MTTQTLKLKSTTDFSLVKLEVLLFLVLWLTYGLTINSDNLGAFNLQQIGVEAIVERGQFALEGSSAPQLQPLGDVFIYEGRKYAAKQPGQFMAGALVYFLLHAAGISYVKNYLLTAALVTFLTTSLVTAASGIAVWRIARLCAPVRSTLFWPLLTTLVYGLATTVFTYSGIAHHDGLSSGYLVIAFYLVLHFSRGEHFTPPTQARAGLRAGAVGLFLGLTITTSMLTFFMAVLVGLYFLSLHRWKLVPAMLLGGLLGLLPLLIYDAVNFGNPLLLPNIAGNYADTFFHLELKNFLNKLRFYSWMVAHYAPVLALGLVGLVLYPRPLRREQLVMCGLVLVLAGYIFNVDTEGGCQYGPRYLLPAMPYAALGIIGFGYLATRRHRVVAGSAVVLAGLLSFLINAVGALHGAMYCHVTEYALWPYLSVIMRGEMRSFPLASWLFIPLLMSIGLLMIFIVLAQRQLKSGQRENATIRA